MFLLNKVKPRPDFKVECRPQPTFRNVHLKKIFILGPELKTRIPGISSIGSEVKKDSYVGRPLRRGRREVELKKVGRRRHKGRPRASLDTNIRQHLKERELKPSLEDAQNLASNNAEWKKRRKYHSYDLR